MDNDIDHNHQHARRFLIAFGLIAMLASTLPVAAAERTLQDDAHKPRPVIGLVLGGGGAKGASHVGVLQALEALQVPIDVIVGTSMGAIIGGLYAAGLSPDELAHQLETIDWQVALQDDSPRQQRSLRRKIEDSSSLTRLNLGLGIEGFKFPAGLIHGQHLTRLLTTLAAPAEGIDDFDRLPLRFRAIASDIDSGEMVILGKGDLALAMRASMGIPGAIAPVIVDGRRLIDGGITSNVAIDVARMLGADIIIVVDLGLGGTDDDALRSPAHVIDRALDILMRYRSDMQLAQLSASDILIRPALAGFRVADFDLATEIADIGERTTLEHSTELLALAVDDDEWAAYLHRQRTPAAELPLIDFVRLENESRLEDSYLLERLEFIEGAPLDRARLDRAIERLYGTGYFEQVDYRVVHEGSERGGIVRAREKSWGPSYVRFGLLLEDDFDGNSSYTAAAGLLVAPANRRGGEWRLDLQIGERSRLFSDFYQPIEPGSRWFVSPLFDVNRRNVPVFAPGTSDRIADLWVSAAEAALFIGREIGTAAEFRIGVRRVEGNVDLHIGESAAFPDESFSLGMLTARLTLDTLDSLDFPQRGIAATLTWERNRDWLGADVATERVSGTMTLSGTHKRWTLTTSLAGGTIRSGEAIPYLRFELGGLFNLSGYTVGQLSGAHYARGSAVLYRRFGRDRRLFGLPIFVGASLEAGNAWEERSDMSLSDLITAGSLVGGADTPLGPLYLATGFAEGGNRNFYLTLGKTW